MTTASHILEAFIAKDRTYSVHCPSCNRPRRHRLADLPPDRSDPFPYTCPCGAEAKVRLVGFRTAHRKPASIAASFTRPGQARGARIFCTVRDISTAGLRLVTDPLKQLAKDEVLEITLVLELPRKTTVTLPAVIKRVHLASGQLTLSVEFLPLGPAQQRSLDAFIHA